MVALDRTPFEDLPTRYASEPREAYNEFARRIQPLVFQAAFAFVEASGQIASQEVVDGLAERIVAEFVPEFDSGEPRMILRRFATAIRRALDPAAFEQISFRYFVQLPIYHMKDACELRMLAAAYQDGLKPGVAARMATRFNMSEDRAALTIAAANKSLAEILRRKAGELGPLTEGIVLP